MGTVRTNFYYAVSETANDKVNTAILKQELEELPPGSLSVSVLSVVTNGTSITIVLGGNATASDEDSVDAAVAAHEGEDFEPVPAFEFSEAESDDSGDRGIEQTKASLNVGPLSVGTYLIAYNMECYLNLASTTSRVQGRLFINKNNDSPVERAECNNAELVPLNPLAGSFPMAVKDGETISVSLRFQQMGAVDNIAKARRARISVIKVNG
jgi:hypothetical protein